MGLIRSKGNDSKVQMPITPMLDMTFQLLFFFLLNYHPSAPEGEYELALPTEKPTISENKENVAPDKDISDADDEEVKEPPEVTVTIKAIQGDDPQTAGQISAVSVQLKGGDDTQIDAPQGGDTEERTRKWMDELQRYLKKARETLTNKNDAVMKGGRGLKWQYMVKVRDACQRGGFTNAHFSPPGDG
jgi:biopolymer transport protein ExbD